MTTLPGNHDIRLPPASLEILAVARAASGEGLGLAAAIVNAVRARPRLAIALLVPIVYFGSTTVAHALIPLLLGVLAAGVVLNEVVCYVRDCGDGAVAVTPPTKCVFCPIFVLLSCQGGAYSRALYLLFAPMALSLARFLFMVYLAIALAKLFVWPKAGGEEVQNIITRSGLFFFIVIALTVGVAGGQNPWIFDWLFDLLQGLALAIATMAIDYISQQGAGGTLKASIEGFSGGCSSIKGFASAGGAVAGFGSIATQVAQSYADLWMHVEIGIWPVIQIVSTRLTPAHFSLSGTVSALILAAPYVFVMGVFGAFMVQTMFYFVAICGGAPFLIAGLMFKTSQGWAMSALRLLVGGSMTIFFSAIAMGFTVSLIIGNVAMIAPQVSGECTNLPGSLPRMGWDDSLSMEVPLAASPGCDAVMMNMYSITSAEYWVAFLIGFISIMLHLAAPRIASNVSGSNDSATTAATVTAVGQMAAAKVLGVSRLGAAKLAGPAGDAAGATGGYARSLAASLLSRFAGKGGVQ